MLSWKNWSTLQKLAEAADMPKEVVDHCREQLKALLRAESAEAKARCDAGTCTEEDLTYAAYARCACGAGLAYHKGVGIWGYWDCSDILTGRKKIENEEDAKVHKQFPFQFYDIKSENQPSAKGATTRPQPIKEEVVVEGS